MKTNKEFNNTYNKPVISYKKSTHEMIEISVQGDGGGGTKGETKERMRSSHEPLSSQELHDETPKLLLFEIMKSFDFND